MLRPSFVIELEVEVHTFKLQASMSSIKESGVIKQDSTGIVNQAAVAPSLSTQPFTPPSQSPSANANERADLSQSQCVLTAMTSC